MLNIIFNVVSIVFSLFSLALIKPFLELIFSDAPQTTIAAPFVFSAEGLYNYFNEWLSGIITERGATYALWYICAVVVVMFLFKNLFRYLALFVIAPLRNGIIRDLRQRLYQKLLHLPLSFFTHQRKGDVLARTSTDVTEVEWSILNVLEASVKEPFTVLIYLLALIYISPSLTFLVLIILPITGLIIGLIGKSLKRTSGKAQHQLGVLLSIMEESFSGIKIIQAFSAAPTRLKKFGQENDRHFGLMNQLLWKRDLASPLSEFLGVLVVVSVLYLGGTMVLGQSIKLSASSFITYLAIFSQIIPPAKAFSTAFYHLKKGEASLARITEILNIPQQDRLQGSIEKKSFENEIHFKNVSFSYEDATVLQNIHLKIKKGQTIALVGTSGSGKTTLVDLLAGFYTARSGEILIDDIPISSISTKSLRDLIAIVTQNAILFNESASANIALGKKRDIKQMIQSTKTAQAHDFIEKLENGYDEPLGEGGEKLSGGEKQRLTIARALYKNAPILIIDEGTSSLDAASEHLLQKAMKEVMQRTTTIVIAHRLATIQNADLIYVMKEGKIIELGTHSELMEKRGEYSTLVRLQAL